MNDRTRDYPIEQHDSITRGKEAKEKTTGAITEERISQDIGHGGSQGLRNGVCQGTLARWMHSGNKEGRMEPLGCGISLMGSGLLSGEPDQHEAEEDIQPYEYKRCIPYWEKGQPPYRVSGNRAVTMQIHIECKMY